MELEEKVNILLVDDNQQTLVALEAILEDLGQNLIKANSGTEALKQVLNYNFAVILLDVAMPDMDGFETAQLIRNRERSQNTPIILFSSASTTDTEILRGYSVGAVDYLVKPFMPEFLKAKIAVFIELYKKTSLINAHAEQERERARLQSLKILQASEDRFLKVIRSLAIGVGLMDLNGRLISINPRLQTMLGYPPEDLNGRFLFDLIHPDDTALDLELYQALAQGKRDNYQLEHRYVRKDNELLWGHLTVSLIRDSDNEPSFVIAMIENVTERKQTEQELQARLVELDFVAGLGQRALTGIDIQEFMNEIVKGVAQTLNVEYCKILELLHDQPAFGFRAGVGWQEGLIGTKIGGNALNSQAGYTLLLLANEPLIINDLRTESRFWVPTLLRNHNVISGMSVTISGKKEPFGVLGVYTTSLRVFTKDDINFLKTVANVLALAIEHKNTEKERDRILMEAAAAHRIKDEL
jgi:PAS domain S-box-containing protein